MATIDEIADAVRGQTTLAGGLSVLLSALQIQINDALVDSGITPELHAKIDAAFSELSANHQTLADAVTANTPNAA